MDERWTRTRRDALADPEDRSAALAAERERKRAGALTDEALADALWFARKERKPSAAPAVSPVDVAVTRRGVVEMIPTPFPVAEERGPCCARFHAAVEEAGGGDPQVMARAVVVWSLHLRSRDHCIHIVRGNRAAWMEWANAAGVL
jgi:hypothetical protein